MVTVPDAVSPSVNWAPACGPATRLWLAGLSGSSQTARTPPSCKTDTSTTVIPTVPANGTACSSAATAATSIVTPPSYRSVAPNAIHAHGLTGPLAPADVDPLPAPVEEVQLVDPDGHAE